MYVCPPGLWYLLETEQRALMQVMGWLKRKMDKSNHWVTGWLESENSSLEMRVSSPTESTVFRKDRVQSGICVQLYISTGKDNTTSLRNLFQCSHTLTESKCFLMFRQNSMCYNLHRLSQGTIEKSQSFSFTFPWASLLQTEHSQPFLSLLKWKMPQSLDSLCGLHWTHSLFKPYILNFDLDQS